MNQENKLVINNRIYEYQTSFNNLYNDIFELSKLIDQGLIVGNDDIPNLINSKFATKFRLIEDDFHKTTNWLNEYIKSVKELECCFLNPNVVTDNSFLKEALDIYRNEL